jgi:transposase-like protein
MLAAVPVQCLQCHRSYVVKYGKQANGTQRYRSNGPDGTRRNFLLQYHNTGCLPETKQRIVDLMLNGCGMRDTVRVLGVSSATIINTLKNGLALVGSPEMVIHQLKEQHQRFGYDIFCANRRMGLMPSAQSLKFLRLFGKEESRLLPSKGG